MMKNGGLHSLKFALIGAFALLTSKAFAVDDSVRVAHVRAAALDGDAYAVTRDVLENQGESILPLLDEKISSKDWRQRFLAQVLRLKIREPEKSTRWRWALLYWKSRLQLNDAGQLVTTLPNEAVKAAASQGDKLVPGEVAIDENAVPVIIDCLREFSSGSTFVDTEHVVSEALAALRHLNDPNTAAPILYYLYNHEEQALQTLIRLGKPALPALHEALAGAAKPWPHPRRAELAAKVLADIGDQSSAKLLVEGLDNLASPTSIPVFCKAISRLKPINGPEVLFRQLHKLAFDRPDDVRNPDADIYLAVRDALLSLEDAAIPTLNKNQTPDKPIQTRAIAAGVAYELAHAAELNSLYEEAGREWVTAFPDWARRVDKGEAKLRALGRNLFWKRSYNNLPLKELLEKAPALLLIEAAAMTQDQQLIGRLSRLAGNEKAFELLTWLLLTERPNWAARRAAILPLAQVGAMTAIGVYREFIKKHPLVELDRIVEGAILVGDRQAGRLLVELLELEGAKRSFDAGRKQQAAAIRQIAAVLQSDSPNLATLLKLDEPAYQITAARVLAGRHDPACVPLLFSAAVHPGAGDQRLATSVGSQQAQDLLVQVGEPAVNAIDEAAAVSEAKYAGLLAESLKLRIRNQQLSRRYLQAMNRQWPGFNWHAGPDLGAYQSAGKQVAKILGTDAIPLLEATLVWNPNSSRARVAAFALAEFQQDRSLEVVIAQAGQLGWARRESIAAAVLKGFGDKGIAAAQTVNAPDPDKRGFDRRRGRHRAATSALTRSGEPEGVEGILSGLQLAAQGKLDPDKTRIYLNLAAKYEDQRLIPAVIAAIQRHGNLVSRSALAALAPYDDPRLVPIFIMLLGDRYADDEALLGLARIKGDATTLFLLDQLKQANDRAIQVGVIQALAKLRPSRGFVATAKLDREKIEEMVPKISAALIDQLSAEDGAVQTEAAESLVEFMHGRKDKKTIDALLKWLDGQADPPSKVLEYLVWTNDPAVAPVLLKIYRKAPLKRADLAAHLAALNYEDACDEIASALRQRLASDALLKNAWRIPEIEILADFGENGCNLLVELTKTEDNLQFRVESYNALARQRYVAALEPMASLFQELIRNGLWDPRVEPRLHNDRSDAYRFLVGMLAEGLIALDPKSAYPLIANACLEVDDEDVRKQLAYRLRTLLRKRPNLRQADVPIDSPKSELASVESDIDVPLLAACEIWLEAMTRYHGQLPPNVRKRLIASGPDSLMIGVELFYDFPVPTKEQLSGALAGLTHRDEAVRRAATAMLAVRKYPRELLDDALASTDGKALEMGRAIQSWRHRGGRILDADSTTRGEFTNMLLIEWPIDQMREFSIAHLDQLVTIPNEAYMWSEKPLFPLLLSVRYSPEPSERVLLDDFIKKATPEAKKVASSVNQRGFGGFYGTNFSRWGALPPK